MKEDSSRVLFLLVAGLLSFRWIVLSIEPLWLDETVSYWAIHRSYADMVAKIIQYQGHGPLYYSIVWLCVRIFGDTDFAIRLPSMIFMLLAAWYLYRLGVLLGSPSIARVAVIVFLGLDTTVFAASNCRAYSLALFACIASVVALVEALNTRRADSLIAAALWAGIMTHSQPLFYAALVVPLLLVCLRWRDFVSLDLSAIGGAVLAYCIVALATFPQIQLLMRRKDLLFFSSTPSWFEMLGENFHILLTGFVVGILAILWLSARSRLERPREITVLTFIFFIWWIVAPTVLFPILIKLFGGSLYSPRYFSWNSFGYCLALATIVCSLRSEKFQLIIMLFLALIYTLREYPNVHEGSGWKGASEYANQILKDNSVPVFAYTGLVEVNDSQWLEDQEKRSYILAPFARYPLQVIPTPITLSCPRAAEEPDVFRSLKAEDEIVVIARRTYKTTERGKTESTKLIANCFDGFGLRLSSQKEFGQIVVQEFLKRPSPGKSVDENRKAL